MAEEFEGDLAGAVFWGADLRGARFRDVDLTGVRISHAWVVDVEVDALIDRLVINGVDVTAYVHERDRWHPLRSLLRPTEPAQMRAAWSALEAAWDEAVGRARALPEGTVHESVDGEWSFVQTLRHLVMAMDKWFTLPVSGGARFDPVGLPNTGSADLDWPGLEADRQPSLEEVLAVRAEQSRRFDEHLATLTPDDLDRIVDVLENGPHPVRECVLTILEEGFWHLRYADRDLAHLEAA